MIKESTPHCKKDLTDDIIHEESLQEHDLATPIPSKEEVKAFDPKIIESKLAKPTDLGEFAIHKMIFKKEFTKLITLIKAKLYSVEELN